MLKKNTRLGSSRGWFVGQAGNAPDGQNITVFSHDGVLLKLETVSCAHLLEISLAIASSVMSVDGRVSESSECRKLVDKLHTYIK